MTAYRQGDVLLVPYPFSDQSGSKQRPSVVVSGDMIPISDPELARWLAESPELSIYGGP